MSRRFSRLRSVVALAIVAGGLTVIGGQGASAAADQNGLNNYAGPLSCGVGGQADTKYSVHFDVCGETTNVTSQESLGGLGLNVYEASGDGGTVTQTNQSGRDLAVCVLTPPQFSGPNTISAHSCNFTQISLTGNNDITADVQVVHSFTQDGGTGSVSQDATVALVGRQTSSSGDNTVLGQGTGAAKLRIAETLGSNLSANVPADQEQESLMLADLDQNATSSGDNRIELDLERDQTMSASAASPLQKQDVDNATTDGRALVKQRSDTGTNFYKARADDTKAAGAQVLDNGVLATLRQTQGHTGGGWLMQTDQDSPNNPQGSTVDLGTPPARGPEEDPNSDKDCLTAGVVKKWTLTASGPLGGTTPYNGPATREQNDGLGIPIIGGKSPWTATSYECTSLKAPAETRQTAHVTADGHTKSGWTGAMAAALVSNTTVSDRIDWANRQEVHESLDCFQNTPNTCNTQGGGITGSGTDISATEGTEFAGEVARYVDSSTTQGPYTVSIDWGDESGASGGTIEPDGDQFVVNGTHTYTDDGQFPVSVTLTDGNNNEAGFFTSTATVAGAPVDLTARDDLVANAQTYSGEVATFTDGNIFSEAGDYTATIAWDDGQTTAGTISGGEGTFSVSGSHTYADSDPLGPQTITVTLYENGNPEAIDSDTGQLLTFKYLSSGSFAIGDGNAAVNPAGTVTWWSNEWSSLNQLSGGPAPTSFKGFASQLASTPPKCTDANWNSKTGNSPPPPSTIHSYMALIVTSTVTGGSKPTGDIVKVVVVRTNPGYQPNSGSSGTGSVVAVVCSD